MIGLYVTLIYGALNLFVGMLECIFFIMGILGDHYAVDGISYMVNGIWILILWYILFDYKKRDLDG